MTGSRNERPPSSYSGPIFRHTGPVLGVIRASDGAFGVDLAPDSCPAGVRCKPCDGWKADSRERHRPRAQTDYTSAKSRPFGSEIQMTVCASAEWRDRWPFPCVSSTNTKLTPRVWCESPVWVTGCLPECVNVTAAVPQIAADFLHRASPLGRVKTGCALQRFISAETPGSPAPTTRRNFCAEVLVGQTRWTMGGAYLSGGQ